MKLKDKDQVKGELSSNIQKFIEKKGRETFERAQKHMLEIGKHIQSLKIREALNYFARHYWSDFARPTLMFTACEAVGGDSRKVVPIAVPVMLIAAGMDIHDDIIDQSRFKNNRLTVFGRYGKDVALLLGDSLIFEGFVQLCLALQKVPAQKATKTMEIIKDLFFELGSAEAEELKFRASTDVSLKQYLRLVKRKAADVEAYTYIGGLFGGGTEEEIKALRKYGRILGTLAILRDDFIDMMDEDEVWHRLRKEVVPFPILCAAEKSEIRNEIRQIIAKKKKTKGDARKIIELTINCNGIESSKEIIHKIIAEGISAIKIIKYTDDLKLIIYAMSDIL
ncbi:MAG: polyprenyl synthetase family protein [Candidatus Bathyarchaeia archaeon]